MEDGQEPPESIKQRTIEEAQTWLEDSKFFRDKVYENQRWLMASQLAISSGGIVTLLNMENIDENSRIFALIWFFSSILSLMVFAHLQGNALAETHSVQEAASRAIKRFSRSGDPDELIKAAEPAAKSKAGTYERLSTPFYYIPIIAIVIASLITAEGIQ